MKNLSVHVLEENELELWDRFVDSSPQGNIFNKSYWIKAVSSEFSILVVFENNAIVGGIVLTPLYNKFYRIPKLTPQLGVLLPQYDEKIKYSSVLSKNRQIIQTLIDNLPKFKFFDYNFSYNFNDYLPFIWNNYDINVRYTYMIEDLKDLDKVFSNFEYDTKYTIKKAIKSGVTITDNYSIDDFYEINTRTFKRQNIEIPYSIEFLRNLDDVLIKNNNRKIFFAVKDNKIIAAAYFLYDKKCTYYLMGGADPEFRKTGAQSLLIWEGIKFASTVSEVFDFEGSMVKNIESSFRSYGGRQVMIHNVSKSDFKYKLIYSIASKNKNLIRKFIK